MIPVSLAIIHCLRIEESGAFREGERTHRRRGGINCRIQKPVRWQAGRFFIRDRVAFSNRYGGHILIGVGDDGTVIGVNPATSEGLRRNFANRISNPQVVFPPLYLVLEEARVDGKLVLSLYVPQHSQPVRFGSSTFDRVGDGDVDITNNLHLMEALYQRKPGQYTERKAFPFADLTELRVAELMPTVRQAAVNKRLSHPWRTMEDWDIFKSASLWEHDPTSGVEGVNMAGVLLFGSE